jgi:hypothetical protein
MRQGVLPWLTPRGEHHEACDSNSCGRLPMRITSVLRPRHLPRWLAVIFNGSSRSLFAPRWCARRRLNPAPSFCGSGLLRRSEVVWAEKWLRPCSGSTAAADRTSPSRRPDRSADGGSCVRDHPDAERQTSQGERASRTSNEPVATYRDSAELWRMAQWAERRGRYKWLWRQADARFSDSKETGDPSSSFSS